jgi:hypothetical protein
LIVHVILLVNLGLTGMVCLLCQHVSGRKNVSEGAWCRLQVNQLMVRLLQCGTAVAARAAEVAVGCASVHVAWHDCVAPLYMLLCSTVTVSASINRAAG